MIKKMEIVRFLRKNGYTVLFHPTERETFLVNGKRSFDKTLSQVAVEFHLGRERVRQIVAEFLRKIERIYSKNRKELDNISQIQEVKQKPSVDTLWEVHQAISNLEYSLQQLKKLVERIDTNQNISITSSNSLEAIVDNKNEGYLLSTVKSYLKDLYQDFCSWHQRNNYMGGIYEGEYYFFKKYVDEYINENYLTL